MSAPASPASDWQRLVDLARETGGFTPAASPQAAPAAPRPWPVVVLTFFGAQLAALPLLLVLGLMFGDWLFDSIATYIGAAVLLAGATSLLRGPARALFVEHLAVIGLLIGQGLLVFALVRDFDTDAGAALAAIATVGLALIVRIGWVGAILGAAAAGLLAVATIGANQFRVLSGWFPLVPVAMLAAWALALWLQAQLTRWDLALALEHVLSGWLLTSLAWLALTAGMTMWVGAVIGMDDASGMSLARAPRSGDLPWWPLLWRAASVVAIAAAWARAAQRWPVLRRPPVLCLCLVLSALAAFMPPLGVALAVVMVSLVTHRHWQAACAALACAWIVGAIYYNLHWDLATKAAVLAGAGLLMAALAAWAHRASAPAAHAAPAPAHPLATLWIALAVVATLGLVNTGIWQKETLIRDGRRIYLPLGPVDPRSLMQGDYMTLNFVFSRTLDEELARHEGPRRPRVAARVDEHGVATLHRVLEPGESPGQDLVFELTPRGGRWAVVTDAWFFREGTGEHWAAARFGEFRVAPDGRALLVGLADAQRRAIVPPPAAATPTPVTPAARPPS